MPHYVLRTNQICIQFYRNICRNSSSLLTELWPSYNLRWFINSFLYWLIFSLRYIFSTTINLQGTPLLMFLALLCQNVAQWRAGPSSGDQWEPRTVYIPFLLCLRWCYIGSLNMTMVKAFTPRKMANLQTKLSISQRETSETFTSKPRTFSSPALNVYSLEQNC